jgi:predicted RNA binding protein YcfA (HicA-like mRNA interferase family)
MKSSELHRRVRKNGWKYVKAEGSHYIYEKNGKYYPVPYHGAKEMGKGLVLKIIREMQLK